MEQKKEKFPEHLGHLNKTFLEELNYKLWSTKGARFKAHKRLIERNNLSTSAVSYLTAYLIVFGLIGVYQSVDKPFIDINHIGFGSMAGSILVLIFAQLESAKNYRYEAHLYHTCALEISELYNKIRIRKTLEIEIEDLEVSSIDFCKNIEQKYTDLLMRYTNHQPIDFKLFKLENIGNPNTKQISKAQAILWKVEYFIKNEFLYYILIIAPPVTLIWYWVKLD